MKDLTELLEKLATKLGIPVGELWEALLKQTKIVFWEVVSYMVVTILFLIAAIYFITFSLNGLANLPHSCTPYLDGIKDNEKRYSIILIISIIYLMGVPFLLIRNIKKIVTLKNNPKYWALREMLSILGE